VPSYDLGGNECHPQTRAVASAMSETFELGPTRLRVALAAEEATVLEAEIEPGAGSYWHTHTKEDETVVVLEGELMLDDGHRHVLRRGEAHVVPRGRRHAFANEGEVSVRAYFFCAPGGLERFFRDIASGAPAQQAASRAGLILE
jgi:quercetin dioxygenase-like cupin family protein